MGYLITLNALRTNPSIHKVIIQSLGPALYRVIIELEGKQHILADDHNNVVTSFSLQPLRDMLAEFRISQLLLEQQSAYDEMVGQSVKVANTLRTQLATIP